MESLSGTSTRTAGCVVYDPPPSPTTVSPEKERIPTRGSPESRFEAFDQDAHRLDLGGENGIAGVAAADHRGSANRPPNLAVPIDVDASGLCGGAGNIDHDENLVAHRLARLEARVPSERDAVALLHDLGAPPRARRSRLRRRRDPAVAAGSDPPRVSYRGRCATGQEPGVRSDRCSGCGWRERLGAPERRTRPPPGSDRGVRTTVLGLRRRPRPREHARDNRARDRRARAPSPERGAPRPQRGRKRPLAARPGTTQRSRDWSQAGAGTGSRFARGAFTRSSEGSGWCPRRSGHPAAVWFPQTCAPGCGKNGGARVLPLGLPRRPPAPKIRSNPY